jgi:hypothetical protein
MEQPMGKNSSPVLESLTPPVVVWAYTVRPDEELLRTRPRNFPEMVRQLELGDENYLVNGNYLDAFYRASEKDRQSFIWLEPSSSKTPAADEVFYAHCAAVAEKLAHDYDLIVPDWVNKPRYFLREPLYGGFREDLLTDDLVRMMREVSPKEFSRHNLFVTPNALVRY